MLIPRSSVSLPYTEFTRFWACHVVSRIPSIKHIKSQWLLRTSWASSFSDTRIFVTNRTDLSEGSKNCGRTHWGANHLRLGSLSTIIAKRGWLICTIPNGGWKWDFWLSSTVGGLQIDDFWLRNSHLFSIISPYQATFWEVGHLLSPGSKISLRHMRKVSIAEF